MRRIQPEAARDEDDPRHLDCNILDRLPMSVAAAARETLRVGDCVISMLEGNLEALR